jgi:hypothetical protein
MESMKKHEGLTPQQDDQLFRRSAIPDRLRLPVCCASLVSSNKFGRRAWLAHFKRNGLVTQ